MRSLITGSTGYIGRHLSSHLSDERSVLRLLLRDPNRTGTTANDGTEFVVGDMRDREALSRAVKDVDVIYHLAAATVGNWGERFAATVDGTRNLLALAAEHGVRRVVYVSSLAVYDLAGCQVVDESCPLDPRPEARADYARSKIEAEKIALDYLNHSRLEVSILRPAIVYGAGKIPLSAAGYELKNKVFLMLGNGRQIVPMIYIDDVVEALILAGAHPESPGKVFNIVDPTSPTQLQLLAQVKSRSGVKLHAVALPFFPSVAHVLCRLLPTERQARMSFLYRLRRATTPAHYDGRKVQSELGWHPRVQLSEGLARTLQIPTPHLQRPATLPQ